MSANTPISSKAPLPSIADQAFLIRDIISHCTMRDGSIADETMYLLKYDVVRQLAGIADRLERMSPHEREIRRLVTGR